MCNLGQNNPTKYFHHLKINDWMAWSQIYFPIEIIFVKQIRGAWWLIWNAQVRNSGGGGGRRIVCVCVCVLGEGGGDIANMRGVPLPNALYHTTHIDVSKSIKHQRMSFGYNVP